MMYLKLLQFEWSYQIRKPIFYLFMAFFAFSGWLAGGIGSGAGQNTFANSPYWMSYYMGFSSLIVVFASMFFCVYAMLRDRQHQMEALIFSTSIKKMPFFFSRFFGAYFTTLLIASSFLLGFALAPFMTNIAPERFNSFQFTHYLWIWLIFVVPNAFICTSVLFIVSAISRSAIATYITAILLYGLYFLASIFLNSPLLAQATPASPETLAFAAVMDPLGLSAFFEQTQYWTAHQKNQQLVALSGHFLWNRILWLAIACLLLLATYQLFSFRALNRKVKKRGSQDQYTTPKSVKTQPLVVLNMNWKWTLNTLVRQTKLELQSIFKGLPFLGIIIIWTFIVSTEIYSRINGGGQYNNDIYPTTELMLWLIKEPFSVLGIILVMFYSGELMWKSHQYKFHEILGASPISNAVSFTSKYLAIATVPALLILTSIANAIVFQLSKSYFHVEWGLYLSMFIDPGLQILLVTLVALFIQSIATNKYIGTLFTAFILLAFSPIFSQHIGLHHPLMRFSFLPKLTYSDMTGFQNIPAFQAFALYWLALLAVLSILSFKLWQRGKSSTFFERLRLLKKTWSIPEKVWTTCFFVAFIALGAYIYYHMNVAVDYTSPDQQLAHRAQYERKYKKYESIPRLAVTAIKTEVAIFPKQQKANILADYTLTNQHEFPVDSIFVSERDVLTKLHIPNSTLIFHDTTIGVYLFQLNEALLPHQSIQVHFELDQGGKGFPNSLLIVKNGTYIPQAYIEPLFYYTEHFEIYANQERKKRGLPYKKREAASGDHLHHEETWDAVDVDFETIISTAHDQTAIATGNLINQWEKEGRRYFHYKLNGKTKRNMCYFSANYQQKVEHYRGINIELYYHPTHAYNISHILELTKASLDYCIAHFGPYTQDHIRIAEIPNHWPFGGQAMAGTISMTERGMYLVDLRNKPKIDLVARRVIHEVAHQWWGHTVTPKAIDGAAVLNESLCKYTEVVLLEKLFGIAMVRELSDFSIHQYFSGRGRSNEPEVPLYLARRQAYLPYHKGYTTMLALKEALGEDRMNQALGNLVKQFGKNSSNRCTTLDLMHELYQVADSSQYSLIDDWMKRIISYDLSIAHVNYQKLPNGKYQINAQLMAQRFEYAADGEKQNIEINESIPIGVFTKHPSEMGKHEKPLLMTAAKINHAQQSFSCVVDQLPAYIGIDPYFTRIDANRLDNLKSL
ncbi:MAG: M1 family aminopeptidase [Flammeovirgaceae bacterium]